VQPISDIADVVDSVTFVRPIYAGNGLATVRSADPIKVITVGAASFDSVPVEGGSYASEPMTLTNSPSVSRFVSAALSKSERPKLTAARVAISGGRGMQSGQNFTLIEPIADMLGTAVGPSRAAVGISGAIQHLAGMKDNKVIVAINKDEEAPIFQVADYALVADLFTACQSW